MIKNIIFNLALLSGTFCIPLAEENKDIITSGSEVKLTDIGYSPRVILCPANRADYVGSSAKISQGETEFSKLRLPKANEALVKFFKKSIGDNDLIDFDDIVKNKELTIGLSFSGGGYRSLFTGAGQLLGLDDRAENKSSLSGILQASSYITGVHESNWLIGALIAHGFPVVSELFNSPDMFNFNNGLITPFGDDFSRNQKYWNKISESLSDKNKDFAITPADVLGRALSYQLLGEDKNSEWGKFTLSDVANLDSFKKAEMPYPLLTARFSTYNGKTFRTKILPLEMTPHRINSWGPLFNTSVSTDYFGSFMTLGENPDREFCFDRFDNLGFLMGAASVRSTPFVRDLYVPSSKNNNKPGLNTSLFSIPEKDAETFFMLPTNPLVVTDSSSYLETSMHTGFTWEKDTVSLESFAQPERNVDIIFLFDNTRDGDIELPNFTALKNGITYLQSARMNQPIKSFSNWYDPTNKSPATTSFFSCYETSSPLVIYIPNGLYTENIKMPKNDQAKFSDEEVRSLMNNGFAGLSIGNGEQKDYNLGTCVACAMINYNLLKHKSDSANAPKLPEKCTMCLKKYCKHS